MAVPCAPYGGEDLRNLRRVDIWCRYCGARDDLFMRDGKFYCEWDLPRD